MKFRRRRYEAPEINFIPLIDVLLVILIFLMVTTTYSRYSQLAIKLPTEGKRSEMQVDQETPEPISIAVSKQGELMVNNQAIEKEAQADKLITALEAASKGQEKNKIMIVINADAQATHQSVIHVMEIARNTGFSQLTFATQQE